MNPRVELSELAERGERTLRELGHDRVAVRCADGHGGWPERAPFDAILVTAAPARVPRPLLGQLAEGGRIVIPVGTDVQYIEVLTRTGDDFHGRSTLPVRFVPMTGESEPPS